MVELQWTGCFPLRMVVGWCEALEETGTVRVQKPNRDKFHIQINVEL